jgi:4-amino-4-deoxy-L-arabinose transferase-like glycosyltransferase
MSASASSPATPSPSSTADASTASSGEPPAVSRTRRPAWRLPAGGLHPAFLAAIVLAGAVLRAYVLQSPVGGFDADEATSSLVSRQVLDGTFPAFIRPLHHGGTLLAYARAPFLAVFGPSPLVMKLVEVAAFAIACLLTWRLGRRIFSEKAAQLGAGVMWVYPPATVWESTKVMLYYAPAVCFGTAAMLLCVRLYQRDVADAAGTRAMRRDLVVLGLVMGLAVWTHPIALYTAVPSCGWLAWHRRSLLRHVWLAVPTGLVGGLPWLWNNAHNDWGSLEQPVGQVESSFWGRLTGFFEALLPRLAGLRHQYLGGWYLPPLSGVLYAALMVAALVALRRWKAERTLLLTVALVYPFLFAVPRNSVFVDEPRYGMALLPVLALGAGYALARLLRRDVLTVGAVGALSIVSLASLRNLVVETAGRPELDVLRPVDTDELWPVLRQNGVRLAYADYWIGMRLQFEQHEPFTLLPVNSYYLDYRYTAPAEGSEWAIFPKDSPLVARWTRLVTGQGRTFELQSTERFVLIHTDRPVPFATTLGVLEVPG